MIKYWHPTFETLLISVVFKLHFALYVSIKVLLSSEVSKKIKSLFFNQFVLRQIGMLLSYPRECGVPSSHSVEPEWCAHVQEMACEMLKQLACDSKLGILYLPKEQLGGLEK